MTELQIVNGVKNGDREAMRTMYDLLAGSAMATAVRYLGDSDECRDVLQDCFLRAFTRIDEFSYRGQGSLRAWMTRIVANESINRLKRHDRLTFLDEANVEAPEEEPPDINVVPLEEINRMIAALPKKVYLSIDIDALNRSNFLSKASGAAMSLEQNSFLVRTVSVVLFARVR